MERIMGLIKTEGSSSSKFESGNSIDSTICRVLNMQSDMKVLEYPDRIRNEFDQFIKAGSDKTNNAVYNTAFDSLDEYLGTIGVTNGNIC
jgi:glutathionyl-hydroquinone reductase